MKQRVEEVDAKTDRDDEADDGFGHCDFSLQAVASDGVDTHQGEEQNPDSEIDNVGHDMAPPNSHRTLLLRGVSVQFGMQRRRIRKS
jgi:hypothetical protein